MARGGRRQGAPGQSYSNRSDLNANRAPTQIVTPTPGAVPPPVQAGPQPAQPTQTAAAPAGPPLPPPGALGALGPSLRPNEPLTHGLPTGPGGGPEVLQQFQPDPLVQAVALLSSLPAAHQSAGVRSLMAASQASIANASNPSVAQGPQ